MKQPPLASFMTEAHGLVLSNRLTEATALIQARLGGLPAAAETSRFDGPTIEVQAEPLGTRPQPDAMGTLPRSRPRFSWPDVPAFDPGREAVAARMPSGARFLHLRHEGAAGRRNYRLYVPADLPEGPRPLLVMLHGCTQNPEDFAAGTRMNALAEERKLLVAYPEQDRSANASLCWNWFEPAHQHHGAGEPAILSGIVADIAKSHRVDAARVFAAGLSAGGAMAAVLGATYPGVFAAIAVHSGLPYGSAGDVASALSVMRSGKGAAIRSQSRRSRTIVFHGAGDRTVHPANGARLAGLSDASSGGSEQSSGTVNGRAYIRTIRRRAGDQPAIEHWQIEGLGHAWSGGDASGSYTDPAGPDASREMLRFFLDDAG